MFGRGVYPSSWFIEKRKPTVYIKKTNLSLPEMKQAIIKGISEDKVNWDLANAYLVTTARGISSVLDSDWTTYKVSIGKDKETISISSLVDIQENGSLDQTTGGSPGHDATDYDVLLLLLFLYRKSQLHMKAPTYPLVQKLRNQLQSGNTALFRSVTRSERLYRFEGIAQLHKIAAAYDMFFNRFPDHHQSALGYWTGITRFKHCAGLMSVRQVADLIGVEVKHVSQLIYHRATHYEFSKLTAESDLEESTDPFSYFPYQIDFGLVNRSAYSSVAVPNTFCLMHMIGCFLGSSRSLNATMNLKIFIAPIVANALLVAVACKKNNSGENEDLALPSRSATEVLSQFETEFLEFHRINVVHITNVCTPGMIRILNEYKDDVTQCREGTIGKFLQNYK